MGKSKKIIPVGGVPPIPMIQITPHGDGGIAVKSQFTSQATIMMLLQARDIMISKLVRENTIAEMNQRAGGIVNQDGLPIVSDTKQNGIKEPSDN